jgi:protein disulfide-isomerase A1
MIMKEWVLFALCLLGTSGFEEEDDVLELQDATIDQVLQQYEGLLVEFYAPWCDHCKKLAPELAKAAQRLKMQESPFRIAKMDATANPLSAAKYGIKDYPTLKWFTETVPKVYDGPRGSDGITKWINKQAGVTIHILASVELLNAHIERNEIFVVLFAQQGSKEYKVFEEVAKKFEDFSFGLSTSSEALTAYQVTAPALVMFKAFDDRKVQFTGQFLSQPITEFVKVNRMQWAMPFDDQVADYVFKQKNHIVFVFRSDSKGNEIDAAMREVAAQKKDFIKFTYADLTKESNKRIGDYLGVLPTEQPLAVIVSPIPDGLLKYKLAGGSITAESLRVFVEKYQKKELEPYYKSQEIPANSMEDGVQVLVGKNFESVVMDLTKDVMVEFYAPWCGHCKKLAPEYVQVAAHFKANPNVVIAKMDATANEAIGHSTQGFPTLKFFSTKNKAGVRYDGERTRDGIIKYIEEKGTAKDRSKPEL